MVLGAIGVAMAMRAHLQQRIEVLAIMKSIGARSSDILRIYLLQTVLLGMVGGLIGVFLGLGVEWIFPALLGQFLPMQADLQSPLPLRARRIGHGRADHRSLLPAAAARDSQRSAQSGAAQNGGGAERLQRRVWWATPA